MPTDAQLTQKLKEEHALFRSENDIPAADIGIITRYWPNTGREWISSVAEWILTNHATVTNPMVNGRVRDGVWSLVRVFVDYLETGQPAVFEVLRKGTGLTLTNLNLERSCRKYEDGSRFEMVATLPALPNPNSRTGTTYRIDGINYDLETCTFSGFVVTSTRKYQHVPRHVVHSDAFHTVEEEQHLGCKYYSGNYHSDSGGLSIPEEQTTVGTIIKINISQSDHCCFDISITWDTAISSVSRASERSDALHVDEVTRREIVSSNEEWKDPTTLEATDGKILSVEHTPSASGKTDQKETTATPQNQQRKSVKISHRGKTTVELNTEANAESGTLVDPEALSLSADEHVTKELDHEPTKAGNTRQRMIEHVPQYQHRYTEYLTRYGLACEWWGVNATEEEYNAVVSEAALDATTRNQVQSTSNESDLIDYSITKVPYQVDYTTIEGMIAAESCSMSRRVWFYPKQESREAMRHIIPTSIGSGWLYEYDPRQRDDLLWDIWIRATLTKYRHVNKYVVRDDAREKVEREMHLGAKSGGWSGWQNDSGGGLSIPTPTVSGNTRIDVDVVKRDSCVSDITITSTTIKDMPSTGGGHHHLANYTVDKHTHNDAETATPVTNAIVDVDNVPNEWGKYRTSKRQETGTAGEVPEVTTGSVLEERRVTGGKNQPAPYNPGPGAKGTITGASNTINRYGLFDGHEEHRKGLPADIPESTSGSEQIEIKQSGQRNADAVENPGQGAAGTINHARNNLNAYGLFDTDLTVEVAHAKEYLGVVSGSQLVEVTTDSEDNATAVYNPGVGAKGEITHASNALNRHGLFNARKSVEKATEGKIDQFTSFASEDRIVKTTRVVNSKTIPTVSAPGAGKERRIQGQLNRFSLIDYVDDEAEQKVPNGGKSITWTVKGGNVVFRNIILAHYYDHKLYYTRTVPSLSGNYGQGTSVSYAGNGMWRVHKVMHDVR
ncbi:MAG: hypothetical protein EOM20_16240 [Spartobacteria bacterium]|nr:hypothetical protein [Spartobacteria bacterium]